MPRGDYPGVFPTYKKLKDGTRRTYWYHRASGKRLIGEPGDQEFILSYADAERSLRARHSGKVFNLLSRKYVGSKEFEQLSKNTQREYRRMLAAAEIKFGDLPLEALNDPDVRGEFLEWRSDIADSSGEREADNRISVISAMLSWGVEYRVVKANHVKGFKRLYHVDRSEIVWLPEHIEAFMRVAPIEIQRGLIIALHTGQRQADILRLPWSAYDGVSITLRQGKKRKKGQPAPLVTIPCTAALRRMLDSMPRNSPLILTTKTERSFQKRYFARLWSEAMIEAGLVEISLPGLEEPVELHFHDLRGTAITMLSEADCTPQQIATITGHSLKTINTILERYLARTRALAEQAIFNWENSPRTEFANRLQTATPAPRAPKGKIHA